MVLTTSSTIAVVATASVSTFAATTIAIVVTASVATFVIATELAVTAAVIIALTAVHAR